MPWLVYIVECANGDLYTGITTNVTRRLHEHNHTKRGSKILRSKRPVVVKYVEEFGTKSDALRREAEIKRWTRAEKLKLLTLR